MKVGRLGELLTVAGVLADRSGSDTYPPAETIVRRAGGRVVALDSPEASPPPGKLGYFTDGGRKIAVSVLSRLGRRLFIEFDADTDTIRTNGLDYFGDEVE